MKYILNKIYRTCKVKHFFHPKNLLTIFFQFSFFCICKNETATCWRLLHGPIRDFLSKEFWNRHLKNSARGINHKVDVFFPRMIVFVCCPGIWPSVCECVLVLLFVCVCGSSCTIKIVVWWCVCFLFDCFFALFVCFMFTCFLHCRVFLLSLFVVCLFVCLFVLLTSFLLTFVRLFAFLLLLFFNCLFCLLFGLVPACVRSCVPACLLRIFKLDPIIVVCLVFCFLFLVLVWVFFCVLLLLCLPACLPACLSVYLSAYLSDCLPACLSTCMIVTHTCFFFTVEEVTEAAAAEVEEATGSDRSGGHRASGGASGGSDSSERFCCFCCCCCLFLFCFLFFLSFIFVTCVCLSACLSHCLPACLYVCLSTCLPACLSFYLSASLPACLSVILVFVFLFCDSGGSRGSRGSSGSRGSVSGGSVNVVCSCASLLASVCVTCRYLFVCRCRCCVRVCRVPVFFVCILDVSVCLVTLLFARVCPCFVSVWRRVPLLFDRVCPCFVPACGGVCWCCLLMCVLAVSVCAGCLNCLFAGTVDVSVRVECRRYLFVCVLVLCPCSHMSDVCSSLSLWVCVHLHIISMYTTHALSTTPKSENFYISRGIKYLKYVQKIIINHIIVLI